MSPDTPQAPAPLPPQPAPVLNVLQGTSDNNSRSGNAAISAARGRSSLRIDKTQAAPAAVGSGLNIPS